ncbi:MAG: hypothetical protein JXA14_03860 [Anaerolineae bacterium]|nr:hypothetical protein [Anaerolineae bacterium]
MDYILMLEDWVVQAIEKGEPVEEILRRSLPAPFETWLADGLPFEPNVRALYERMSGDREETNLVAHGR